ncbi:ABC transporter substrate-binding protein [Aquibacillus salsiterrae]|uniref:Sugar ABC transporter substrate-binding protein n=1 Tax=Aquibacillus salsiterrae TaxID=2950439 RepID=A0A9X3WEG9_9BACI|nr:sugar ABC transporter substrate-binding protein [Aquibacillus salsiterrae]MDC3417523.1 sugar ABC transporter substrate-binding protein [Aquibacillus salsiterrae]
MKKILGVAVLILIVGLLTACSNSSSGGGEKKTLDVALWDENASEAVDASIETFKETHPNVKVNVTYTPWSDYWTKLKTSLGGGSGPDVFWMNGPNFYQYSTQGLIKNLEPFISNDSNFEKEKYFPAVVDLYSLEGELYAAPYFVDAVGLFYNKDLFDAAGVDYPDESWTWEDIETVGAKLTDPDNGTYGYAAHTVANQQGYYNLIHQAGGYVISDDKRSSGFNTPEAKEAFTFLKDLIDKGISPSTQSQIETEPRQLFMSNKLAMLPSINVNAAEFQDELGDALGVAPLPAGKEEATIVHGIGWAMNEATEDDELAWELIKSLANEDGNRVIAESGFSIPAIKSISDVWLKSLPGLDLQIFIDAQDNGVAYPVSKRTAEWQDVETKEIQSAFLGQQTIDEALEKVGTKMDEILKEEQED